MYDFLLVRHCNYSSILYHLRELFDVEYYCDLEKLKCGLKITQGH